MRISVVTAVYNREGTIGPAIASIQRQSHADVEHVVQDGGSTDGTLAIVRSMANANTSLVSERDIGIYDAINRGIARASGDVIGLMHSDDVFADDRVLERVASVMADPAIDGVYGDLQYVAADDPKRVVRHWRSGTYSADRLKWGWMPPHPTLYLRRQVFDRLGLYDTSFRIAADYDAMLRYLVIGKVRLGYIPEVLVKMRVGGESNRSLNGIMQKSWEDWKVIRAHKIGGLATLACKNVSKIEQFFSREDKGA